MSINGSEGAFIGRADKEPVLKTSAAGKAWTNFSACVCDGAEGARIAVFEQLGGLQRRSAEAEGMDGPRAACWPERGRPEGRTAGRDWPPAKPKARPDGDEVTAALDRPSLGSRDWQRPADNIEEIPF